MDDAATHGSDATSLTSGWSSIRIQIGLFGNPILNVYHEVGFGCPHMWPSRNSICDKLHW